MLVIGADPEHLGARVGFISVLHTWGSAMTHHPHVHMIAPGGGISPDGARWIACRRGFFLPVLVLSALFRRLMLEKLGAAHKAGKLRFFGEHAHLADADAFAAFMAPLRRTDWFVYSKRPFSGPEAVLAYLARYTHRVAISNRRLIAADACGVTFTFKDYRIEGPGRYKRMTLETGEFIRRFPIHVLPKGFHRIRHYGLLASGARAENLATMCILIAMAAPASKRNQADKPGALATAAAPARLCPCCGSPMLIVETFEGSCRRRRTAPVPAGIDTS
jgi:Putative transposase